MSRRFVYENITAAGQGGECEFPEGLRRGLDGFLDQGERIMRDGIVDFLPELTWCGVTAAGKYRVIRSRDFAWVEAESEEALFAEQESRRQFADAMPAPAVDTDPSTFVDGLARPGAPARADMDVRQ